MAKRSKQLSEFERLLKRLRGADGLDGGDALAPLCHEAADKIEQVLELSAVSDKVADDHYKEILRLRAIVEWMDEQEPGIRRAAEIHLFGFGGDRSASPSSTQERKP